MPLLCNVLFDLFRGIRGKCTDDSISLTASVDWAGSEEDPVTLLPTELNWAGTDNELVRILTKANLSLEWSAVEEPAHSHLGE